MTRSCFSTLPAAARRLFFSAAAAGVFVAFSGVSAQAASCGDDVEGTRVPCACGDVVVSSVTLQAADPVIQNRCMSDGLIVRAPAGSPALTVNLSGLSMTGLGGGTGIRVLRGGEGGALIVGGPAGQPGHVAGFGTGLRANGRDTVAEIRNLVLEGNLRDGLSLHASGTALVDVVSDQNGRDGLRVGSRGADLNGVEAARNKRFGLRGSARSTTGQISATDNGKGAALLSGQAAGGAGVEVSE